MPTKFLTTPQLLSVIPLGKTSLQELCNQGIFLEGLHWCRFPGQNPRKIFWNLDLIIPRCRKPHDGLADALCLLEYARRVVVAGPGT